MTRLASTLTAALALAGCWTDRLVSLGHDLPDACTGCLETMPDAGADAGRPDAGNAKDAGADAGQDAGPADAGQDAGFVDYLEAMTTCVRLDRCLDGFDYGTGARQRLFEHCIQLALLPPSALVEPPGRLIYPWTLDLWTLPVPQWMSHGAVNTCVRAATDCEGVLACFNQGAPAAPCSANPPVSCVGTELRMCAAASQNLRNRLGAAANRSFSFDCQARGLACVVGTGAPTSYGCAAVSCGESTLVAHCAGEVAVNCSSGMRSEQECAPQTKCEVLDAGSGRLEARCAPPDGGAPCNPSVETQRCFGTRLAFCQRGRWYESDCLAGTACRTVGATGFCGVAAECSPVEDVPTCAADGGALELCVLGKKETFPCAAVGGSSCVPPRATEYLSSSRCQ